MAVSRLATNLTEDYLTCSICCEIYKDPRQLSCDHSFCLSCLIDYGQKCRESGQILCPICRTAQVCPTGMSFPTWIESFPSDQLLLAILTTVHKHDQTSLISLEEPDFLETGSKQNNEQKVCTKHNSYIKDMYCFTHALLLCATCAWIDHGPCQCFPLDDCSDKITEKIRQLKSRFDQLSNRVNQIKQKGEQNKDIIEQSKSRSQASLQEVQDVLQQFWSKAQLNVQHLLQSIHQRDNDVINFLTSVSDIQDDILQLTRDLGNVNKTGVKLHTLEMLQEIERRAHEHDECLTNLATSLKSTTPFNLETNAELLQFSTNFRAVGNLKYGTSDNESFQFADLSCLEPSLQNVTTQSANTRTDVAVHSDGNTSHVALLSVGPTSDGAMRPAGPTSDGAMRSADPTSDVAIRSADYTSEADDNYVIVSRDRQPLALVSSSVLFESFSHRVIYVGETVRGIFTLSGVCILGDNVVVVDQYNSLVMKFNVHSGKCVEKITIMEPHHIALIPESRTVLVTCWSSNEIYTVEVEPRLEVKCQPLKTLKHYIGIHVYDRQRMLVSALDKSIDVINFQGQVIHSIRPRYQSRFPGILGGSCILVPADLCRLSADSILVLDGVRKSLVAICFSGKVLWTKHIEGLSGFTVFKETVYVCDGIRNTIITLTKDGKIKDKRFLSNFVGIKRPWALNLSDKLMVVTEDTPSGKFHIVNFGDEKDIVYQKPETIH
ncbi:uncharacterized protein LOC110458973 [Mizuhopecten yessoensis]|uniref:Tripartite motif-containing protein 59 n=1 Tax=Mizuhopecten yessoensis TaxID=6573 RepID=A0A210Q5H5_MIZYE|nr:uncharacterized protein LOC110458973 [Mizuhopecten yessoensis]OWF43987.1 Tripartite motif-containing protein 59 [Mizuhopecten yessoensis]